LPGVGLAVLTGGLGRARRCGGAPIDLPPNDEALDEGRPPGWEMIWSSHLSFVERSDLRIEGGIIARRGPALTPAPGEKC
jgi:hypothetical protein